MADLKEKAESLLSSTTVANMSLDVPTLTALYTVPAGKQAIITKVIIHSPSATLDGMNDVDFGSGAVPTDGFNNITGIADVTATTDYYIISSDNNEYSMVDGDHATAANRTFGMYVVSGSTGAASAKVDVFGYLVSS